jgi:hypothetical protein
MYVDTIANPGLDGVCVRREVQSLGLPRSFDMLIGHVSGSGRCCARHGRQATLNTGSKDRDTDGRSAFPACRLVLKVGRDYWEGITCENL